MGTMEKMRNSTPIVLWVLIFSFGVLWVLQDTQMFDAIAVGPQHVGSVNGDRIALDEYQAVISNYTNSVTQQTGQSITPEMRANIDEQAWNELVNDRLRAQKMEELGISVTDEELINMVTGENPDPFIVQQFADEEGNIDQIALRSAIEDPQNRDIWIAIEQQLRQSRRQQKFNNFITSSLRASNADIERTFVNQNSFAGISYIRIPYADISNDEIQVTDAQLREYYNNNEELFQREESYNIRYVAFEKLATAEDTMRTVQDVEALIPAFSEAEDNGDFLQRYSSSVPFNDSFVPITDIREDYAPVIDLEVGEVSDIHMINGHPHVFKKVAQEGDEINFAVLSYTVIADPVATVDRLAEEADEFSFYAEQQGFQEEVENQGYTISQTTITKGSTFIPGIGAANQLSAELEQMSRGDISSPIEVTNFFIVAQLQQITPAGTRPFEEVQNQIDGIVRLRARRDMTVSNVRNDVSGATTLEEMSQITGAEVLTVENVEKSTLTIEGAGREPAVVGAIFGFNEGETSGVIAGDNAAFVITVNSLDVADASSMTAEQRAAIRSQLEQQKVQVFSQVWLEELRKEATIRDNRHYLISQP